MALAWTFKLKALEFGFAINRLFIVECIFVPRPIEGSGLVSFASGDGSLLSEHDCCPNSSQFFMNKSKDRNASALHRKVSWKLV